MSTDGLKALFLRSLLMAVLVGATIGLVSKVVRLNGGFKYDPPVSESEFQQMGNMTVNEMKAGLAKRRIRMTRWDLLRESVPYSYFWKEVAFDAIVPASGVFCVHVGRVDANKASQSQLT